MQPGVVLPRIVRFAPFEVDLDLLELRKNGAKIKLQEQPFQILGLLISRPGTIVTREEIQQKLWPTGTFVDFEHGVNTAVKKLREALRDDAEEPRFVETVPRRGYRFIGTLEQEPPQNSSQAPLVGTPESSQENRAGKNRYWLAICAATLAFLIALAIPLWRQTRLDHVGPEIASSQQLTFSGQVMPSTAGERLPSIQTDGRRVYYSDSSLKLRFVAISGSPEEYVSPDIRGVLLHISPDGSTLLVRDPETNGLSEASLWLVSAAGGARRRLGDLQGQDAAFAPDGKTIVVAKGLSLFLTNYQGESPRKVATLRGRPSWLRWSPDGKRLRFTVYDSTLGTQTLWQMSEDGSTEQLLKGWKRAERLCCGVWAPDGKSYVFLNFNETRSELWAIPEDHPLFEGNDPLPVNLNSMGVQAVALGSSNVAGKLFVIGRNPLAEVYAAKPEDKNPMKLLPDIPLGHLQYSSGGEWALFTVNGSETLWRMRPDGRDKLQLTVPPLNIVTTAISPDQSRVAITGKLPDQPYKAYWIEMTGGTLHALPTDVVNQADPQWTGDGQSIIFGEPPNYFADSGKLKSIYVSDLKSGRTTKIPGSDNWFSPRVAPDGRLMAAVSIDEKRLAFYNFNDHTWRSFPQPTNFGNPFWSSDSQWIYYQDNSETVRRVYAKDGHSEVVFSPEHLALLFSGASCRTYGFAPGGAFAFTCFRKLSDVFAINWK